MKTLILAGSPGITTMVNTSARAIEELPYKTLSPTGSTKALSIT